MTAGSARYGRGTAGLATAAVAALSASALAGLVWLGADQVLGRGAGHSGLLGDLGLAPAQVDLGRPGTTRPVRPPTPSAPVVRTAGLTQGTTSRGAAPLVPVTPPGVPPTTTTGGGGGGAGNNGNGTGNGGGNGTGNEGGGGGPGPLLHGHPGHRGDSSVPGHRWALQLALADGVDLSAAIAADLPGVGSVPTVDTPRSTQALANAQARVAWALARAQRKAAAAPAPVAPAPPTARPRSAVRTSPARVSVTRGHATPPGHAAVPHPAGSGTGDHPGQAKGVDKSGNGQADYVGKHRRD